MWRQLSLKLLAMILTFSVLAGTTACMGPQQRGGEQQEETEKKEKKEEGGEKEEKKEKKEKKEE